MSKVTRKLVAGTSLAIGLAVSLLGQEARAAEEMIVIGSPSSIGTEAEQGMLRAALDQHELVLTQSLKAVLDRNLKMEQPKLEVASNELRTRG